jgi:hypothetical protein
MGPAGTGKENDKGTQTLDEKPQRDAYRSYQRRCTTRIGVVFTHDTTKDGVDPSVPGIFQSNKAGKTQVEV